MSTLTGYRLAGAAGDSADSNGHRPLGDEDPAAPAATPNVLIYRNDLIEKSETFILSQATALRRYRGVFCGIATRNGGILPKEAPQSLLIAGDRSNAIQSFIKKRLFMGSRFAPDWRNRCRALQPVLLHAHFGVDAAFALPLQVALRVPLIVSLHGYDVTSADDALRRSGGGSLYLRRRQELFARTELFVCVSRFIRDQAIERGYPPEKLWVHSIGIDIENFQPDESVQRRPIVLFVGRLVEKKAARI